LRLSSGLSGCLLGCSAFNGCIFSSDTRLRSKPFSCFRLDSRSTPFKICSAGRSKPFLFDPNCQSLFCSHTLSLGFSRTLRLRLCCGHSLGFCLRCGDTLRLCLRLCCALGFCLLCSQALCFSLCRSDPLGFCLNTSLFGGLGLCSCFGLRLSGSNALGFRLGSSFCLSLCRDLSFYCGLSRCLLCQSPVLSRTLSSCTRCRLTSLIKLGLLSLSSRFSCCGSFCGDSFCFNSCCIFLSGGDTLCFGLSRCLLCGSPFCGCLRCSYALRFSGGSGLCCGYALRFCGTLSLGLCGGCPLSLGLSCGCPLSFGLSSSHALSLCLSGSCALGFSLSSSLRRSLCLSIRRWRRYILIASPADDRIVIKRILRNVTDARSVLIDGLNRRRRVIGGLYGRRRILVHRSSDGLLKGRAIEIVHVKHRH
jgi:hypothetical protein